MSIDSYFEEDEMVASIRADNSSYLEKELNNMRKNYFITSLRIKDRGKEIFSWGTDHDTFKSGEQYWVDKTGHLLAGKSFFIKDSNGNVVPGLECSLWINMSHQMGVGKFDLNLVPSSSPVSKRDIVFIDNVYIKINYLHFMAHLIRTNPAVVTVTFFFSVLLYVVLILLLQKYKLEVSWTERLISLTSILEEKDAYTYGHGNRVAEYSAAIASKLGLKEEEVQQITLAAECHDLGKIFVPNEILKKKGKLTDSEMKEIQKHSVDSERIFLNLIDNRKIADIIRHHHERWDGEGYPDGLKKEQIPFESRIIELADTFDAMISNRPYRKAMPVEKALSIIEENLDSQFDPDLAKIAIPVLFEASRPENKPPVEQKQAYLGKKIFQRAY